MARKMWLIVTIIVILSLLLRSCGTDSAANLVGRWQGEEKNGVFYSEIEFFSDGTHVTRQQSWCGTYTTDGDRLRLSGKMSSESFTFKLDDGNNKLTLINKLGHSATYYRVD